MTGEESSTRDYDLAPSPDAVMHVAEIGAEGHPVLVIDGAMRDPQSLRRFAAQEVVFEAVAGNLYPGVRAPCAIDYAKVMMRVLDPMIRRIWGLQNVVLSGAECFLSIVTTPPEQLVPMQRIPHIDTTNPLQFAVLHFLCGTEGGGTAFFRQKATGFEAITAQREGQWAAARDAALAAPGKPNGYVDAHDPDYEEIAMLEAQFNRLLVYRSCQLHSDRIPPAMPLDPDPLKGRLTANLFIGYRPAN